MIELNHRDSAVVLEALTEAVRADEDVLDSIRAPEGGIDLHCKTMARVILRRLNRWSRVHKKVTGKKIRLKGYTRRLMGELL